MSPLTMYEYNFVGHHKLEALLLLQVVVPELPCLDEQLLGVLARLAPAGALYRVLPYTVLDGVITQQFLVLALHFTPHLTNTVDIGYCDHRLVTKF